MVPVASNESVCTKAVRVEISKLLKVGGIVFVETHFSFSSHERPWHFFQFSDMALRTLFSKALGFECIEAGMSNPMVGRFTTLSDRYLRNRRIAGLYCHSEFLGKKTRDVELICLKKEMLNSFAISTVAYLDHLWVNKNFEDESYHLSLFFI